jgi:CRP-like cAMP-binding protein
MRESDFTLQLLQLFNSDVPEMTRKQKTALTQAVADVTGQGTGHKLPTCRIVPFVTGRRPTYEAAHPGLGSSDNASMICGASDPETNKSYIMFELSGLEPYISQDRASLGLDLTLSFAGTDMSQETSPIPGWDKRPIQPKIFEYREGEAPTLRTIPLGEAEGNRLVIALSPERDFLPIDWTWQELDPQVQAAASDHADPFTFGHLYTQVVYVSIRLTYRGIPVAVSQALIDVCDSRRFGTLYQRLMDRMLKLDLREQAAAAGIEALDVSYHPWFPVLLIGSDKAALYTDALVEDIVHKKRHLTDPRWLMRVGLYLEFLTCIGIIEVVKEELGDLLSPAERTAYEQHPFFAEIRDRVNLKGWREVWQLRGVALPRFGVPQTGPVSALNLLKKKKATLTFLKVHHDDLKHAIDLAGKNDHYAQETWCRIFRDAERAIFRKVDDAFPELRYLDYSVKEICLWYQKEKSVGSKRLLRQVSSILGDQDGLFASASTQYRASMNEVAAWAKEQGLMDYTDKECIPQQVSLIMAHMEKQQGRIEQLQRRDGYTSSLNPLQKLQDREMVSPEQVYDMLTETRIFRGLTNKERRYLANSARAIMLGPMERIIIEGKEGSSLFLVVSGAFEVLIRLPDGVDKVIDIKRPGDIIGEVSLLTGAARTATVRAVESVTLFEIGKLQIQPLLEERPEMLDELAAVMETNIQTIDKQLEAYDIELGPSSMKDRFLRFFFGI